MRRLSRPWRGSCHDREDISVRILEPTDSDPMRPQLRDAIVGLQTWRVVILELDAPAPQVRHRCVEVVDLEPGYRTAARAGGRRRIDDDESPAPALETKAGRPLLTNI